MLDDNYKERVLLFRDKDISGFSSFHVRKVINLGYNVILISSLRVPSAVYVGDSVKVAHRWGVGNESRRRNKGCNSPSLMPN